MKNTLRELYALEQLSGGNSCVHRLHPTVKLLTTVVFLITVVSFDRYALGRLTPYIFYPALLAALSETPYSMLFKRFLIALPFCFFAGITNILFDRTQAFSLGAITVSYGVVSFFSILFKTYLCVMAVLLLVSVTPFARITNSMRRLKTPSLFIIMFEMTYRYIGVLLEETYSMYTAYSLRSPNGKGIAMKDMGSFTGQLLLRSFDRADRVYNAMRCKGYTLGYNPGYGLHSFPQNGIKLKYQDIIFCSVTCLLCVVFRIINVNALFAEIFTRFA
ncbi:MAG: cobalt ECF transporter T component CbiQ [Treponema sp.]|jgi:cobalt/nickel transport system permease protein|nr:cobalt ECF transporter T component CbiQ [Treponema sp.]